MTKASDSLQDAGLFDACFYFEGACIMKTKAEILDLVGKCFKRRRLSQS